MMSQPIKTFENLTSETAPAGGNAITLAPGVAPTYEERHLIEMRARYARAEAMANILTDGLLWVGRQGKRLLAAVKEDFKLRTAEAQLRRMSDRELADIGLCRGDIPFAVHEPVGVTPPVQAGAGTVGAAKENLRSAA